MEAKQLKALGLLLLTTVGLFLSFDAKGRDPDLTFKGAISLYEVFKIGADLSGGTIGSGGEITMEVWSDIIGDGRDFPNILLYKLVNATPIEHFFSGQPETISDPSLLGIIGNEYPKNWVTNDIKSSTLVTKQYYCNNDWRGGNNPFIDLMGSTIPVTIRIYLDNSTFSGALIPGIGVFSNNEDGIIGLKFDPAHPCNQGTAFAQITKEWNALKSLPDNVHSTTVDLAYAAHRGFWGNDLGRGPVENTDPAIAAALPYTNVIESDITITRDKVVVVSHDYNLQRLTNYSGPNPDNTFIFNLDFDDIKDLRLRRRNFEVTEHKFIQLRDLISYMVKYNTILTIDIKERASRKNPITGECSAECEVTREIRDKGWVEIFGKILEVAEEMDAWQYLAVKTPLTVNRIKQLLPVDKYRLMGKVLYFPVIQPGTNVSNSIRIINDWHNNARNYLIGFETNFKTPDDPVMKEFLYNGQTYKNILHYVVERTGYRPGMYPEEPMGAKGIVDRYAQWLFKDLRADFRGDHLWLMELPYFPVSILTTDRPDIWQTVKQLYDQ